MSKPESLKRRGMKYLKWVLVILIILTDLVLWVAQGALAGVPGDANGDGKITMGDVIKVERIILELDPPAFGADANGNGKIDMSDVTYIERVLLTLSPILGDANGDGQVNAADLTKAERIIAGMDAPTPGADADRNGAVNEQDLSRIKWIIFQ